MINVLNDPMYVFLEKKNIVCRYISALSHQIFLSLSNMNKVEDDKFILVSQFSKLMSITRQIQHLRNIFFVLRVALDSLEEIYTIIGKIQYIGVLQA